MAERRPGEKLCAGGRIGEQRCRRGSEEEEGPLGKLKIPTDIEIK
jgi:hypothetical protein